MTTGGATIEPARSAQRAIQDIFADWHGSLSPPAAPRVLARVLALLAPMRRWDGSEPPAADQLLANAQISVDTEAPDRLRLTLDPFAGQPFCEVGKGELAAVLETLECPPLMERALHLYRLGYALPRTFWVGVAPVGSGCLVKAYVSSPDPALRGWLPHVARDAGWLPPKLEPAFLHVYGQLTPSMAILEGIGISLRDRRWLGTTFYLRSSLPWAAVTSGLLAGVLHLSPSQSLERLTEVFADEPAVVGWSIECDASGALVDLKLEATVNGPYFDERVAAYARGMGLDARPFEELAHAIEAAALSVGGSAAPAVVSLRFVQGALRGMVAYFPLAIPLGRLPVSSESR